MTPLVCSAVTLSPGNCDLEQIRRRQLGPQSVLLASNRPVSAKIMSPERAPACYLRWAFWARPMPSDGFIKKYLTPCVERIHLPPFRFSFSSGS